MIFYARRIGKKQVPSLCFCSRLLASLLKDVQNSRLLEPRFEISKMERERMKLW